MTDGAEARQISSIDDLMSIIEFKSIGFNEVSAKRTDEEDEPDHFQMEVSSMLAEDEIRVRCRAVVAGAGGSYVAEAVGHFGLTSPAEIEHPTILEFIQRVGVMAVYPYLRTAITDSSAKIGRKTPVLRLLKPGEVKLEPEPRGS